MIVDLRAVEFIRPPAVLWCAIYLLLCKHRGVASALWVPENLGVCVYLKSLGLFDLLKESGVDIDDRGVRTKTDAKVVLPLTHLKSLGHVQIIADDAYGSLMEQGLGNPQVQRAVSEVFAELAMNAVEHAQSAVQPIGFIQFYEQEQGPRFAFGVADGGIGIRASLARNTALQKPIPYDWTAIEVAMEELVSGTGAPTRGIGLAGVREEMRQGGRGLVLHSGMGRFTISEELETAASRSVLFPGTLAYASVSI